MATVESFLAGLGKGGRPQVCLVHGDLVLAEPAAERIAAALAQALGCSPNHIEPHRRPPSLSPLLQDLRTFSLFASAKVALVVDSAVFADRGAAADLIDDAAESLPSLPSDNGEDRGLTARERQAASRLFQALHLFDLDPQAGAPEQILGELPSWVLEGGTARRGRGARARGKKQVEEIRSSLAGLLEAARREGITGAGQSDLSALADAIRGGLPDGHVLVLAERSAAEDHPVVRLLAERKAVVAVGSVEAAERGGGWQGLDLLATELERQTGVGIAPDAMAELARRTLRQEGDGRKKGIDADSTARLAGEYRKLANLSPAAGRIDRKLVEKAVEDRGEEDVWQLLDAVAAGRGGEALDRLHRLILAADDPLAARLSFFSLFASFCRQLTAIRGLMRASRVPAGESNYARFKDRHAPMLQGEVPGGGKNPIAGLHPFRLHRAYLAASHLPEPFLARLPAELLETEMQLKGETSEADTALADLVARVSTAGRSAAARPMAR
jgi:DNA polymerase III delta subunit